MLSKLLLQNWRAHAHTEIPLSPFTLLVGPNATGKTSVLEALYLLGRLFQKPSDPASPGGFSGRTAPQWLCRQGAAEPAEAVAWSADSSWNVGLRISQPDAVVSVTTGESAEQRAQQAISYPLIPSGSIELGTQELGKLPQQARQLASVLQLTLDAKQLAAPGIDLGSDSRLLQSGAGLAPLLMEMKLNHTRDFEALLESASRIIPILQGVNFERHQRNRVENKVDIRELVCELRLDFSDATSLPAHAASEGTLLVLGFLAALYAPSRPQLILMDDIDRALHPRAQRVFAQQLKALQSKMGVQIVATTHSPFMVDAFEANQIVVLLRDRRTKQIVAHRLSEHPEADRLLDALRTGEFWLARGEQFEDSEGEAAES